MLIALDNACFPGTRIQMYDLFDEASLENKASIKKTPANVPKEAKKSVVATARMDIINRFFNINKMLSKSQKRKYDYHGISTNGKTVSILYEKKGQVARKQNSTKDKFVKDLTETERAQFLNMDIVAGDPGVSDTIFSFVKSTNNPTLMTDERLSKRNKLQVDNAYYANGNVRPIHKYLYHFKLSKNSYYRDTLLDSKLINMKLFNESYKNTIDIEKIWQEVPETKFTNKNQVLTYLE
jgi:hypothetical protein